MNEIECFLHILNIFIFFFQEFLEAAISQLLSKENM